MKKGLPTAAKLVAAKIAEYDEYIRRCQRAHTSAGVLSKVLPAFNGKVINAGFLKRINAALTEAGAPCGLSFRLYGWNSEPRRPNAYGVRAVFWDESAGRDQCGEIVYLLANEGRLDAERTAAAASAFCSLMCARVADYKDQISRFKMMVEPLQRAFDALAEVGQIEGSAYLDIEKMFESGAYLDFLESGPICRYSDQYKAVADAEAGRLD